MAQIRFGLVGCGSISRLSHAPALARIEGVTLEAVCDPDVERARHLAESFSIGEAYETLESMLASSELDAVVIASPNYAHFEQAMLSIQAGLHVYIEKPMCSSGIEAWDLVAAAEAKNVRLTVGCNQRLWPQHRYAKELMDEGVIGSVRLIRTSLHESWRLYQGGVADSDFRLNLAESVYGALLDLASHRVDLACWWAGSAPRRVLAIVKHVSSVGFPQALDDLVVINVEFDSGVVAIVTNDRFSPAVSNICEVYGDHGTIFASSEATNPFQSVPLAVYTDRDYDWESYPSLLKAYRYPANFWATDIVSAELEKRWISVVPPRSSSFDALLEDFISAIREHTVPLVSPEQAAQVMDVLGAAKISADEQRWVSIPMR